MQMKTINSLLNIGSNINIGSNTIFPTSTNESSNNLFLTLMNTVNTSSTNNPAIQQQEQTINEEPGQGLSDMIQILFSDQVEQSESPSNQSIKSLANPSTIEQVISTITQLVTKYMDDSLIKALNVSTDSSLGVGREQNTSVDLGEDANVNLGFNINSSSGILINKNVGLYDNKNLVSNTNIKPDLSTNINADTDKKLYMDMDTTQLNKVMTDLLDIIERKIVEVLKDDNTIGNITSSMIEKTELPSLLADLKALEVSAKTTQESTSYEKIAETMQEMREFMVNLQNRLDITSSIPKISQKGKKIYSYPNDGDSFKSTVLKVQNASKNEKSTESNPVTPIGGVERNTVQKINKQSESDKTSDLSLKEGRSFREISEDFWDIAFMTNEHIKQNVQPTTDMVSQDSNLLDGLDLAVDSMLQDNSLSTNVKPEVEVQQVPTSIDTEDLLENQKSTINQEKQVAMETKALVQNKFLTFDGNLLSIQKNMLQDKDTNLGISSTEKNVQSTKEQQTLMKMLSLNSLSTSEQSKSELKSTINNLLTQLDKQLATKDPATSVVQKVMNPLLIGSLKKSEEMLNQTSTNITQLAATNQLESDTLIVNSLQNSFLRQEPLVLMNGQTNQMVRSSNLEQQFEQILSNSSFTKVGNAQTLSIRLAPDHLGSIRIEITQNEGNMIAKIFTSSADAKEVLDTQLSSLKHGLSNQNLQVDKIDIVLTGQQQEKANKDPQQQQQQEQDQQTPQRERNQSDEDEEKRKRTFLEELINMGNRGVNT
ncbi:flagellar hook-length control protein FliK [Bacillus sp. B1-b2]|uniref:flagellar hook-length control protein FliK n=1 Tax=Bacillus sp. B1-b2 TaxID=2653201 RepID=UPI001261D271|nr:flagellar hook-length control protein FliK [Bacillus sp. B1-b2]KAB7668642.1 hypothetical protein F9279_12465 [Bacillus sp. B1-b2]